MDTLTDENSPFKINGYELVIDTRSIEAYDDFTAAYVYNGDAKTPEEYAARAIGARISCAFADARFEGNRSR